MLPHTNAPKDNIAADADTANRKLNLPADLEVQGGGARQPQHNPPRSESQTAVPVTQADAEEGLPVANKGKSPGNGG